MGRPEPIAPQSLAVFGRPLLVVGHAIVVKGGQTAWWVAQVHLVTRVRWVRVEKHPQKPGKHDNCRERDCAPSALQGGSVPLIRVGTCNRRPACPVGASTALTGGGNGAASAECLLLYVWRPFQQNHKHVLIGYGPQRQADPRAVDPPIQVETATWSPGGQLDWWVKERQEWWGRVRGAGGRQRWIRAADLGHPSGSHDLSCDPQTNRSCLSNHPPGSLVLMALA